MPDPPAEPAFVAATSNSISLQLFLSGDSNGDHFSEHELWMAAGETDNEDSYAFMASYDTFTQSLSHTVTFATDGIVTGQIYSFKFRAKNSKGYSEFSNLASIAAIEPPNQPGAPWVNYELSGHDSLHIEWSRVADAASPGGLVSGYSLFMDDGYGGRFTEIFNSVGTSPLITEYLVTSGIKLSLTYRFKVQAHNYNTLAPSAVSDITSVQACVKPSQFARPSKLSTTTESIAIRWNEPADNGGCSITGYSVHIDDGASGSFIEANVDNDD